MDLLQFPLNHMLSTSQNNNILLVLLPSFAKYNEVLEFSENYDFFGYPGKTYGLVLIYCSLLELRYDQMVQSLG